MKVVSKSRDETEAVARDFGDSLSPRVGEATVICLHGDLGSGKTTFVQFLGKYLGVEEVMLSPTFVIQKQYLLPDSGKFTKLIHIDAYRLKNGDELKLLNHEEYLRDPNNIICVEWAENVESVIPKDSIEIRLSGVSEFEREIDIVSGSEVVK